MKTISNNLSYPWAPPAGIGSAPAVMTNNQGWGN